MYAHNEEFNSNEEHPVEQHVRRYDTGPMPCCFTTYLRVRNITDARGAMQDILQHRSQRQRLDYPDLSPAALQREQSTQTKATDGITYQITVHKSERDACRKWANGASC